MLRYCWLYFFFFFFSSRRRHTRLQGDWSSDVCSSDLTTRRPPVSGTTVQNAPAGMEPIGAPSPSSVTNSSPSPPSVTLDAPTASPTRSSGSAPGVSVVGGGGPGQAAAARARRLASPCLAQRCVELCDGDVDVRIRVCAGDEARLEGRRREEHTARQGGAVPPREQVRVRGLCLREVPHGPGGPIDAPQRAGMAPARRHAVPPRGVPYTRHQPRGSLLQPVVETRALGLAQRGEAGRHR